MTKLFVVCAEEDEVPHGHVKRAELLRKALVDRGYTLVVPQEQTTGRAQRVAPSQYDFCALDSCKALIALIDERSTRVGVLIHVALHRGVRVILITRDSANGPPPDWVIGLRQLYPKLLAFRQCRGNHPVGEMLPQVLAALHEVFDLPRPLSHDASV